VHLGIVIDLKRCVGCNSCTVACRMEHGTPAGILFHKVKKYEVGKYPSAKLRFLPMLCMHCQDAACIKVCPTGATYKRDDGLVLIDEKKCMGCRYCVIACPYDSRRFLGEIVNYYGGKGVTPFEKVKQKAFTRGTVVKCNFCEHRLREGLLPACVVTCPAEARFFGDLDDPDSEVSRLIVDGNGAPLHEEFGTKPSVYYLPA
jgi:molybdopterin-containing oxidoreductase family iron-sulfur binding subunit